MSDARFATFKHAYKGMQCGHCDAWVPSRHLMAVFHVKNRLGLGVYCYACSRAEMDRLTAEYYRQKAVA